MAALAVFIAHANAQKSAPGEPLSRDEVRVCVEHEVQIQANARLVEARIASFQRDTEAVDAEAGTLAKAQQALKPSDRAGRDDLARRIDAHNARVRGLDATADALNQDTERHAAAVASYNAGCAKRAYQQQDREAALAAVGHAQGAAASAALPSRSAGPFEEGLAAYDAGRFELAFALWSPLAEAGNAAAQFNLGTLYETGQGVARDDAAAAAWFLKAAERGDLPA